MLTLGPKTEFHKAFIDGKWIETSKRFSVMNPTTMEPFAEVADCGPEEARIAVNAAVRAFETWSKTTAYERAAILMKWHALILDHADELARIMAHEMGKPVVEGRGEVKYAAAFASWFAEEAKRAYGEIIPTHDNNKRLFTMKKPVGPAYGITPWNFPAGMVTRKAAPALAAGCTFIMKPAEQTPLTALAIASLWEEAGGPPGTLQIITALDPVPVSEVIINDPPYPEGDVHGQHRGRQETLRAVSSDDEAHLARAGRTRALYHLRGRRHRSRGHGRDRVQIPQRRPSLRFSKPHLRRREDLRYVCRSSRRQSRRHQSRQSARGRHAPRAARRPARLRQSAKHTSTTPFQRAPLRAPAGSRGAPPVSSSSRPC